MRGFFEKQSQKNLVDRKERYFDKQPEKTEKLSIKRNS